MDTSPKCTIRLVAGKKSTGEPVFEQVLAEKLEPADTYRVVASPGLVLGIAAGDVLRVDLSAGEFQIVSRGGNICVQFYGPHALGDSVVDELRSLGARRDGRAPNLTVISVPATHGFDELEKVLNQAVARNPDAEWYYGNVYDAEDGVTPLNWWK